MKPWIKIVLLVNCGIVIVFAAILLRSNFGLKTTRYEVPMNGTSANIVFLGDLHSCLFGRNNSRIIRRVARQEPDVICVVGDMLNADDGMEKLDQYLQLLRDLTKLAPTYVSYGNTDISFEKRNQISLAEKVIETGAVFLEENFVDIDVNGSRLRIGGMYNYAFPHHMSLNEWESSHTYSFLRSFEQTEAAKVLLCHRPDSFFFYDAYLNFDIDLLLCGHTHGGLIRVPFKGGIIASDQGIFPKYDYGKFSMDDTTMIITSGFAGSGNVPRFFNTPEIVCISLTPNGQ